MFENQNLFIGLKCLFISQDILFKFILNLCINHILSRVWKPELYNKYWWDGVMLQFTIKIKGLTTWYGTNENDKNLHSTNFLYLFSFHTQRFYCLIPIVIYNMVDSFLLVHRFVSSMVHWVREIWKQDHVKLTGVGRKKEMFYLDISWIHDWLVT